MRRGSRARGSSRKSSAGQRPRADETLEVVGDQRDQRRFDSQPGEGGERRLEAAARPGDAARDRSVPGGPPPPTARCRLPLPRVRCRPRSDRGPAPSAPPPAPATTPAAGRRGSAPPASPGDGRVGTGWSGDRRDRPRSESANPATPPTQSRKVNPGDASQPPGRRHIITGASRAYSAQAATGSGPLGADPRAGSMVCRTRCRVDFHPVTRPRCIGELAKAATSAGPTAWSSAQRPATSTASAPASRLTWTAAVPVIITSPASPRRSK